MAADVHPAWRRRSQVAEIGTKWPAANGDHLLRPSLRDGLVFSWLAQQAIP
jgi:hypothetical protein